MIANLRAPIAELKSPLAQAKALYEKHGMDFEADLEYHLAHGFVVALPTCFAMASAIQSDGKHIDTWFVKVAAGDLAQLVRLIPVPLPFLAFCRGPEEKQLRIYRTARIRELARCAGIIRLRAAALRMTK